jgi:hypothetical protein
MMGTKVRTFAQLPERTSRSKTCSQRTTSTADWKARLDLSFVRDLGGRSTPTAAGPPGTLSSSSSSNSSCSSRPSARSAS